MAAVLVAIAIPIFTTRLEQSRETTDIANLRSAYAAGQVAALSGLKDGTKVTDNKDYWYDTDSGDGLIDATAAKLKLGQGTKTDGHANTSNLPGVITYTTTTDARQKGIAVQFSDGLVKSVQFQ